MLHIILCVNDNPRSTSTEQKDIWTTVPGEDLVTSENRDFKLLKGQEKACGTIEYYPKDGNHQHDSVWQRGLNEFLIPHSIASLSKPSLYLSGMFLLYPAKHTEGKRPAVSMETNRLSN